VVISQIQFLDEKSKFKKILLVVITLSCTPKAKILYKKPPAFYHQSIKNLMGSELCK